jgi:polyhydroxyalkanoate synthesis regulator phasin
VSTLRPLLDHWYLGTSEGAKEAAARNVASISEKIANRIDDYIESGRLTAEQGRKAFDDPAFALLLNDSLKSASKTDNEEKHGVLATLIAERMTQTNDSAERHFIAIARNGVEHLGSRQLRLLGAICVARYWIVDEFETKGSQESDFAFYVELCNVEVRPHWDTPIIRQDIEHLEMLSLLKTSDDRLTKRLVGGGIGCPMVEKAAQRFENQMTLWETPVIKHLNQQMVGALNDEGIIQTQLAFRNLELTPAGLIVGAAMHAILRGIPFESGKWD